MAAGFLLILKYDERAAGRVANKTAAVDRELT
jgi:hypothetical protein